jgi:hypothetical protein
MPKIRGGKSMVQIKNSSAIAASIFKGTNNLLRENEDRKGQQKYDLYDKRERSEENKTKGNTYFKSPQHTEKRKEKKKQDCY